MSTWRQGLGYLLALSLLLVSLIGLTACRSTGTYSATFLDSFDTVLTVTVGASDHIAADKIISDVHTIVTDLHARFDIYNPHTFDDGTVGLYDVNRAAGNGEALPVHEDILALLRLGQEMYALSQGQVNVMMGAVLRLWHDARMAGDRLPDSNALEEAGGHCAIESLVIEENVGTGGARVSITDPNASIDVGAIAKGYVMDRVLAYARVEGVASMLVNLGGHVLAIGNHPDGDPWQVSVPDPREEGAFMRFDVTDASIVTSGDYERVFTLDGVAYHHLIDPITGYPATTYRAVTVILPHALTREADGYSTSLFFLSHEEGAALLTAAAAQMDGARDVVRAVWFSADGETFTYPNGG